MGLPCVTLHSPGAIGQQVVAELQNGEEVLRGQIEEIWNAALVVRAIEGDQEFAPAESAAQKLHEELIAVAERLFGVTLSDALPIYLAMERTTYGRWEDRPRVQWPRPVVS